MLKVLVDEQELKVGQWWLTEAREAVFTRGCSVARIGFIQSGPRQGEPESRFVSIPSDSPPRLLYMREVDLIDDLRLIAQMALAHLAWVEFYY